MRRVVLGLCALSLLLLLTSCAGVPRPESDESTLVIGSFILDYPDGIFEYNARTIPVGIYITIRNNTQDSTFVVRTMEGGYFYFLSNGSDSYSLVSYRYMFTAAGRQEYTLQGGFKAAFTAAPGQICYLGDIVFRNAKPRKTEEVTDAAGGKHTSWSYEQTATRDDKPDQVISFLQKQDANSPWITRTVVSAQVQ
jgi:hypothetical protein